MTRPAGYLDYDDIDMPRHVSLEEQEQTGLARRNTFVAPLPQARPMPPPAQVDPYAQAASEMHEVRALYTHDPVSRGKAMFIKTMGISLFLWGLTLAGLALLDSLSFMVWLLWASLEGGIIFIVLAWIDHKEHPLSVRAKLADGFLGIMRREQSMRHVATYGADLVREARELE